MGGGGEWRAREGGGAREGETCHERRSGQPRACSAGVVDCWICHSEYVLKIDMLFIRVVQVLVHASMMTKGRS